MHAITRDVYKTAKDLYSRGYTAAQVARLTGLSNSTVYRIRNAKSYKGKNGYLIVLRPEKNKYDNIMDSYLDDMRPKRWWRRGYRKGTK